MADHGDLDVEAFFHRGVPVEHGVVQHVPGQFLGDSVLGVHAQTAEIEKADAVVRAAFVPVGQIVGNQAPVIGQLFRKGYGGKVRRIPGDGSVRVYGFRRRGGFFSGLLRFGLRAGGEGRRRKQNSESKGGQLLFFYIGTPFRNGSLKT